MHKAFPRISVGDLKKLPIKDVNIKIEKDRIIHTKIVELVDSILVYKQEKFKIKTPQEKTSLQRQIEATDKQIDQLVYQLYGLTEEEIKIVEGQ